MLDDEDFFGPEQLFGEDDAPQRVLGAPTGVANNVSVSQIDAKGGGRIDPCIHAGEHEVTLGRWEGQVTIGKGVDVGFVLGSQVGLN